MPAVPIVSKSKRNYYFSGTNIPFESKLSHPKHFNWNEALAVILVQCLKLATYFDFHFDFEKANNIWKQVVENICFRAVKIYN